MPLSPRAPTLGLIAGVLASLLLPAPTTAQTPPTAQEIAAYTGLHAAAAKGDVGEIARLAKAGANLEARDGHGRTPLIVAAFRRDVATARALIAAGADLNALESQAYDVITIAAVLDDLEMLKLAIASGGNTRAITSPYKGTALIAAAHLGHAEVVAALSRRQGPSRPCQQPGLDRAHRGHRAGRRRPAPPGDRGGAHQGRCRPQSCRWQGCFAFVARPRTRIWQNCRNAGAGGRQALSA